MKTQRLSRKAVLGVDAAWTPSGQSGVALAVAEGRGWRAAHVAPGYEAFLSLEPGQAAWTPGRKGTPADPARLLARARALAGPGARVLAAAVDMPLAPHGRVRGRREADQAVSRAFGAAGCSTHSPTAERPGALGETFSRGFESRGFRVAVVDDRPGGADLLEVYPHPALLRLTGEAKRLPYKTAKSGAYWPGASPAERIANLCAVQARILSALREVMDIPPQVFDIPGPDRLPTLSALKPYEDALDALVCAWVGITFLEGRAEALGDRESAIWVPA